MKEFPEDMKELLQHNSTVLHPQMRAVFCQALILLRNKNLINPISVLELFFSLLRCQDKKLRKMLYIHIVKDIKNINVKSKNNAVNRSLQNYMYTMLSDSNTIAAKMSLDVMIELYKKNVWNDTKTVNVIATACFSTTTKVLVSSLQFFIGKDVKSEESESEDEEEKKSMSQLALSYRVGKRTKKRAKQLERAKVAAKKVKKGKKVETFNFSALHMLHDSQSFCEKLFKQLEKTTERFEVKLMMMELVSKLIGLHQLFLFNFYPFLQRFIQPHQRDVTKILLFAAWSAHELIPPEIIEPVIKTLVNNFVTERNSGEVMAVGLNAVREICSRCPLVMTEDLLQDLTQYKSHHDKSVMMGARSLIQLFREINPALLFKKDRGKPNEAQMEHKVKAYGEVDAIDYIPGAEVILEDGETKKEKEKENGGWESMSEDEADTEPEGWIDVHHSSDEDTVGKMKC